jgi:peroxiredoxin
LLEKRNRHPMLSPGDNAPDLRIPDQDGVPRQLSELWRRPLALFFVRHLGCPFCREHLHEVRDEYEKFQAAGGDVVAVTMGTPEQTAAFRASLRLPFLCLADEKQEAYRAFEVPRGSVSQVAGPAVWGAGLKALLRGGIGVPQGDVQQLQSTVVVDSHGVVRYIHRPTNSADNPPNDEIVKLLASLRDDPPASPADAAANAPASGE